MIAPAMARRFSWPRESPPALRRARRLAAAQPVALARKSNVCWLALPLGRGVTKRLFIVWIGGRVGGVDPFAPGAVHLRLVGHVGDVDGGGEDAALAGAGLVHLFHDAAEPLR